MSTETERPLGHDIDCEADFGATGQENPCRCEERARLARHEAVTAEIEAEDAIWRELR